MAIKIGLPKPNDDCGYKGMKGFLRQLELSVHHAQKALEEMERNGELSEQSYITYRFPKMDLYSREDDDKGFVKVHVDEESDGMCEIEIELNEN